MKTTTRLPKGERLFGNLPLFKTPTFFLLCMLAIYTIPGLNAQIKLNTTPVTGGDVQTSILISPDGNTVVYRADQDTDGVTELYAVPITGGTATKLNPTPVTGGDVQTSILISPDGNTVVYRADQDTDNVTELYAVPITGGTATKLNPTLVSGGDVGSAFLISPDGNTVVYRADQDTDNVTELYAVPITGGTATKLNPTLVSGGIVLSDILISPDSNTVVYLADQDTDSVNELYAVPITGGTATKLNSTLVSGRDVQSNILISPDGNTVVYRADQDTVNVVELYAVPITGGTPTKLNSTLVSGGDVQTSILISPDGNTVVYRADQDTDGVTELYAVPITGGTPTKLNSTLVSGGDVQTSILISPDGNTVVYGADQDTDNVFELYAVPITGGTATKLNPTLVSGGDVQTGTLISPDGNTVVYRADQDTDSVNELYAIPITGGTATKLNPTLVSGGDVQSGTLISPDGNTAVYRADQDTDAVNELYAVSTRCPGTITTFDGTSWDNSPPTASTFAIIAGNYNTATPGLGDITACQLIINTGVTLTVSDNNFVSVVNDITNNGTLNITNVGSVVQVDEAATTTNNGTITVAKTTPSLNPRDFILLSSPMSVETRAGVYSSANRVFGINSALFTPDPAVMTAVNFLDTNGDYLVPGVTNLAVGEGYLVFPQAVTAMGAVNYAHTYTQGTLNSGTINKTLTYNGPATTNNFNLVGNPYASAIDTDALITANAAINEVYFWEHITEPNEALPGFSTENFSMDDVSLRNLIGGTASANGGTAPGQFMASGQGFAVLAQQAESGSTTPLTFTNAVRVTGNNGAPRSSEQDNKLWLRLDSDTYTLSSSAVIGFVPQASPAIDPGYDSNRMDTTIGLFSTLESGQQLTIQGREVFNAEMEIAMGFSTRIPDAETYTISIDRMEGFDLENNDIFLIDNVLNTSTDLKAGLYAFAESETIQPNRFTLIFQERALNVDDTVLNENTISLYPNPTTDQITLTYTGSQSLNELRVTDIQGRLVKLLDLTNFNGSRTIDVSTLNSGLYFFQVDNGQSTVTTKVIIK